MKISQPTMPDDAIVEIPEKRVKFFGMTGKMLLPSPSSIAAMVKKIPAGEVTTTRHLAAALAASFQVEAVCPVTLRKSLQSLCNDPIVPFWRVIKANGELTAIFPGGILGQSTRLQSEGCQLDQTGKVPRIRDFRNRLADLDG